METIDMTTTLTTLASITASTAAAVVIQEMGLHEDQRPLDSSLGQQIMQAVAAGMLAAPVRLWAGAVVRLLFAVC